MVTVQHRFLGWRWVSRDIEYGVIPRHLCPVSHIWIMYMWLKTARTWLFHWLRCIGHAYSTLMLSITHYQLKHWARKKIRELIAREPNYFLSSMKPFNRSVCGQRTQFNQLFPINIPLILLSQMSYLCILQSRTKLCLKVNVILDSWVLCNESHLNILNWTQWIKWSLKATVLVHFHNLAKSSLNILLYIYCSVWQKKKKSLRLSLGIGPWLC